jgi:hypothetical protein
MIRNLLRAMALDVDLYNHVEATPQLTGQAFLVVIVANTMASVGTWIGLEFSVGKEITSFFNRWLGLGSSPLTEEGGFLVVVVVGVAVAVAGWMVWAFVTAFVGTRLFKGTTSFGEMLRVLGYAQSPRVIGIIPLLGPVGSVWALAASVVAIREGQEFDTWRAIVTAGIGWLAWFIALWSVSLLGIAIL